MDWKKEEKIFAYGGGILAVAGLIFAIYAYRKQQSGNSDQLAQEQADAYNQQLQDQQLQSELASLSGSGIAAVPDTTANNSGSSSDSFLQELGAILNGGSSTSGSGGSTSGSGSGGSSTSGSDVVVGGVIKIPPTPTQTKTLTYNTGVGTRTETITVPVSTPLSVRNGVLYGGAQS